MSKPKLGLPPSRLEQAREEHRQLYKEFLPTLDRYQEMAAKALKLQVEIFNGTLTTAFPTAELRHRDLVTTISAREMPSKLEKILAEVERLNVKITAICYDARTFTFWLFSDATI